VTTISSPTEQSARPEVLAFLRDIKENPEDETPRLILADWLEEHGAEHDIARAELIRVQCEMARRSPSDPQRVALQTRVNELSSAHAPFWLGPLRQLEHARSFERGLLQLHVEARPLLALAAGGLADTEAYAWVDGLRIRSGVTAALGRLVGSGFLRGLNSLGLRRCALRSTAVVMLCKAAELASLRALDLGENTIGPEGVRSLVRSPHLHRLQRLNLDQNSLGFDGLRELEKADFLPSLTALELNGNWMGTETAVALVSSRKLENLKVLSLALDNLTDPAVVALASSPALKQLRRLDLRSNQLGDVSARALASSWHLAELVWLEMAGNRMSAEGMTMLRDRFGDAVQLGAQGVLGPSG
jgi:uncharacterized protein (TIGR02996 family)